MLVPLGTDRDGSRPAHAVRFLITINALLHAAMLAGVGSWLCTAAELDRAAAMLSHGLDGFPSTQAIERLAFSLKLSLTPGETPWWTWLTAMFVHDPDSLLHVLGNMIFLWAFGKTVESHVGFWRFICLYVLGGLAGWLGHWLVSGSPVHGASGATSSIAFLVVAFFPRSNTRVLFLIGMGILVIPTSWLVGTFFAIDLIRLLLDSTGAIFTRVAVGAHLGGALFGLAAGMLLLRLGWAPRGEWDLLHLWSQRKRRKAFRAALRGETPSAPATSPPAPRRVPEASPRQSPDPLPDARQQLRSAVSHALRSTDSHALAARLRAFIAADPSACLPPDEQLDAATRVLQRGDVALAAQAYANFLATHAGDARTSEVKLLLASLYIRRLGRRDEARPLLVGLLDRLSEPTQRGLVHELADECGAASETRA
jgi:membrane associated rhomboid family serine protease